MRCKDLVSQASHLIDAASNSAVGASLRAHLADCSDCSRYVAQLRLTVRSLRTLGAPPPSPASREAALSAFRARGESSRTAP